MTLVPDGCAAPALEHDGRRVAAPDVHASFVAALGPFRHAGGPDQLIRRRGGARPSVRADEARHSSWVAYSTYPTPMLPRHLRPRVRRIRRDGDPAIGHVLAAAPRRGGGVVLTLRVELPRGTGVTIDRPVAGQDLPAGAPAVGDRVPVRYDRRSPELVEIDVAVLRAGPA